MMETVERRTCETCGKNLKKQNTGTKCSACKAKAGEYGKPRASKSPQKKNGHQVEQLDGAESENLRAQFTMLAKGLGEDPDALIDGFCEGWIETARGGAKKALNGEAD